MTTLEYLEKVDETLSWFESFMHDQEGKDVTEARFNLNKVRAQLLIHAKEKHLTRVSAVQDDSSHWYVIPHEMIKEFNVDRGDYEMSSGGFDMKWGKYRTGGDLNLIQLYAEL